MELGLREWLLVFGAVIVLAVLTHGFWEMRRRARARIRINIGKGIDVNAFPDDESCNGELMGPARVVDLPAHSDAADVPMLMDPLEAPVRERSRGHAGFSALSDEEAEPAPAGADRVDQGRPLPEPPEDAPVIVLNVLGRDNKRFGGEEILQVLLACGLQWGEMQIFHRHAGVRGDGPLQFSVANAVEPGVFDLDRMHDLTTPGLTFFMEMRPGTDVEQSYEYLFETANYTANKLGGQLCDERRNPLQKSTIAAHRELARDFAHRYAYAPA